MIFLESRKNIASLTEGEWEKLRILKGLLLPCKQATEDLGGDTYVSCSITIPLVSHLSRVMKLSDDDPSYVARFKTCFLETLKVVRDVNVEFLKVATALDPRFKTLRCIPKEERDSVWEAVRVQLGIHCRDRSITEEQNRIASAPCPKKPKYVFDSLSDDDDLHSEANDSEDVDGALSLYRGQVEIGQEEDPLKWWSTQRSAFPAVFRLAQRFLGSPATTVPCERLFSRAGDINSEKRAALSPEHVNMLVCTNNWLQT